MSPIMWRLLHPIQWRDGRRYRRTYGARSVTLAEVEAMWADAGCPTVRYIRNADGTLTKETT